MKNKRSVFTVILLAITIILLSVMSGCSGSKEDSRDTVYEDMKKAFEQSGLLSSNIGLFSKTEKEGSVSYGECGSGVVIKEENGTYYALTSAHVVSVDNAQLLVFTTNTEMKSETIPGVDYNVLDPSTYDKMYSASIEYISSRDDLAIISFSTDEKLSTITVAEEDPKIKDRIMCIGNPQNEWFAVSYGTVTSGIEKFGETHGFPSNVMKHSAYINAGSSGGAALNDKMQLVGIVPGGSFSPDGKTFNYGVLIPASEIKLCLDEWGR